MRYDNANGASETITADLVVDASDAVPSARSAAFAPPPLPEERWMMTISDPIAGLAEMQTLIETPWSVATLVFAFSRHSWTTSGGF